MAVGTAELQRDITFYKSLGDLLKVLRSVAISQFHAYEKKIKPFEAFSQVVEGFLSQVDLTAISHSFIKPKVNMLGVVAITSDAGLLGGLNQQVIKMALTDHGKRPMKVVVIGEKGKIYLQGVKTEVVAFEGVKEEKIFNQTIALRNYLIKEVLSGNIGELRIVYPKAISLVYQKIETMDILPYGSLKVKGQLADVANYMMESSMESVVEYLVYLWVGNLLYDIFSMSRLAEFAARFMHLEECTRKLEEVDQELKFKYFKIKHEITDRGIRELFAARTLYANR